MYYVDISKLISKKQFTTNLKVNHYKNKEINLNKQILLLDIKSFTLRLYFISHH